MPPKPDLVFHTAHIAVEAIHSAFTVQPSSAKPAQDISHATRPMAPIIGDWVSDSEDESEPNDPQSAPSFVQTSEHAKLSRHSVLPVEASILETTPNSTSSKTKVITKSKPVSVTAARPVSAVVPKIMATKPRHARPLHTNTNSNNRRHKTRSKFSKTSNSFPKVTAAHAKIVSAAKGKKGKWVWRPKQNTLDHDSSASKLLKRQLNHDKEVINSGCSQHMTRNISYLSDFQELNGGYVAFGGNSMGGKITDFKLPDKNQVLLRVPRENNMYNVNLKDIVPSGDLTCFFAKETIDESNLWHRRLGHLPDENQVLLRVHRENNMYNVDLKNIVPSGDLTCLFAKETLDGSGPTWLFDIDTLTKTMNYQPVTAGNQSNPSACVQKQFDAEKAEEDNVQQYVLFLVWSSGSTNPQNANDDAAFGGKKPESEVYVSPSSSAQTKKHDVKTKREAKGKISTNNTNTFSVVGPSNTVVSLTHGKYSNVNTSQYPDDRNMPELEDITYSDDEEDVGAKADFTNLKTTITVSPIPTTRVRKDHHVTQIIGDLSLATQTRSMTRVAKDQDGKSASTPIDTKKPLLKDPDGKDVDVHTYRSMIGSLMYLTSSRPDIMFAVYACARFQVTPKALHLHAFKRIFRYLKGKPHLGLWYPKDSPFNLVAYSDNDYAGTSLDRKSTTGGCQFLGCRLISWQCKKKIVVASSSIEAEYVAAASCCAQVLWIQNQLLDYGATITAASTLILAATITAAPSAARRIKGIVIRDPEETSTPSIIIHSEPKSKDKEKGILVEEPNTLKKQAQIEQDEAYARELEAELNKIINWDDVIDQVQRKEKEDNDVMRYQALKRKPPTEAQAKKNMMIYLRNMAGFKMDYFKEMSYDDIRLIFEKKFNSNVAFLEKTREQMEEEDSKALKRTSESQAEKAAKKHKLDEEVEELKRHFQIVPNDDDDVFTEATPLARKREDIHLQEKAAKKQKLDEEVEELKKHLQIVPNDEDDVYTEATPLARKVSVIDYEIYSENNKPYYKIMRAYGSHQLFLSFLSILRNFDKEDLEVLWLVKERFASLKPKNFLDDFLLTTLTYMFVKPNVQSQVWKNQRTVHGLAKRRYPLIRFTLDQMLNNVRLEVKEETEVSLELLRFVRQQQQEGFGLE
uniref:Uncharacterized protein n=1 Tax=Tanacetum cinerariifolium TaxID=118510 RepID=A0A6L2LD94_TANCI|nr:hypothetical protein [Tanacetum cinerariifolium]